MSIPAEPKTPKEYWEIVKVYAPKLLERSGQIYIWDEIKGDLDKIMTKDQEVTPTIKELCNLEMPSSLGVLEGQGFDNIIAGIIKGLQNMQIKQGVAPHQLPENAPKIVSYQTRIPSSPGIIITAEDNSQSRESAKYKEEDKKRFKAREEKLEKADATEACKEKLAEELGGDPKDWKRLKKYKVGGKIIRTFENKASKERAAVTFDDWDEDEPLQVTMGDYEAPVPGTFPRPIGKDYSGKVIFMLGENQEEDSMDFFCGPETNDGRLCDQGDAGTTEALNEIFKDYKDKDMGAAESYHTICPKPGQTLEELQNIVKARLEKAGAVCESWDKDIEID